MPTPAENIHMSRNLFASGTQTNFAGVTTPLNATAVDWRFVSVRPKSSSNPIRKDGTRAYGSWTREASYQWPGSGFYTDFEPGTASRRSISGQVTRSGSPRAVQMATAERLLNDARMKALAGMSESHMQFNVACAEARSTMKGVTKFATKAARGLGDLWSSAVNGARNIGGAKGVAARKHLGELANQPPYRWKDIPGDYLGYLYGLRPLADDIANGLDQLGGLAKKEMSYGYTVRATRKLSEPFKALADPIVSVYDHLVCQGVRNSIGRVRYDYSFPQWWIENTPVVTPFSEAWEMTRLSFVLDWVLPVGNWVSAMESAQFDPYFKAGFELAVCEEVVQGPFLQERPNLIRKVYMDNEGWRTRSYFMVRTALTSEQRPTFRTKFPSFRNYLGVNHAAQALALMTQAFTTPPNQWRKR